MSVTLTCVTTNFSHTGGDTAMQTTVSINNDKAYYAYDTSTAAEFTVTADITTSQILCTLSAETTLAGFQWINEGTHESSGLGMYLNPTNDLVDDAGSSASHSFSDESSILRTWLNGSFTSTAVTKVAFGKPNATINEAWTFYGLNLLTTAAASAPTYMWFDVWTLAADESSTENTKIYMPAEANICGDDQEVFSTDGRVALLPVEIEAVGDYNYVKHGQCIDTPEDKYFMVPTSSNTEIFSAIWGAEGTASYERFDLASTSVTYTDSDSGSWDVYEVQSTDGSFNQVNFWYLANQKDMTYTDVAGQISGNDVSSNVLLGCFDYDDIFEGGHYWSWVLDTATADTDLDVNTWAYCKDVAGAADEYVVFTGGDGDHKPGCFSFSDSDALNWKTDLNQVADSLCDDTDYDSAYSHVYLSSYQSVFDYPVYQGTFENPDLNIVGWVEDSLDASLANVFQIVEGREEKDLDSDCVTIQSRDGGAVSLDFTFKTDYELTTVQYNIPTEGTTITAKGLNNDYVCATTIQQGSVANWGLADCTGAEYSTFSGLTFENSQGEFQLCGLIVNHINSASSWNYWFVNPWSYEDQQSIQLGSDPCVNEDSIFDGSSYVEYTLGGSDGAVTISHYMCGDGTADLRFALGSTEQFTTATFETDVLDSDAQDNLFDMSVEDIAGLYHFSQASYADYDIDGLTRNYNWVFYFGLGPLDAETQELIVVSDDIVYQGCYEHNTDVFTEVILFGENTWSGYTEADCTAAAQLMLFDYAVITGNGLTEEGCYGVMEDDVASLQALTRADDANCHDWCDSNRVGMCGGRDFADVYSLYSAPSFTDDGYSEPVVTPEESSSDDDWVYPDDPLEPVFPDAPEMATPPSESSSEDEEVAAGARIAIAAATAISALAISA